MANISLSLFLSLSPLTSKEKLWEWSYLPLPPPLSLFLSFSPLKRNCWDDHLYFSLSPKEKWWGLPYLSLALLREMVGVTMPLSLSLSLS